jgi:hypothetical protein
MWPTAERPARRVRPASIDALEHHMLEEAARPGAIINGPVVVTAWARRERRRPRASR